jgi:hypothetical protein
MGLLYNWKSGRAVRWLAAALLVALMVILVMPAPAGIIVSSVNGQASSSATTWGSGNFNITFTFNTVNGFANANAFAFDSNNENANGQSHASLSLTSPAADGSQILSGHVDTSGSSNANTFNASDSGNAFVSGSFTLTQPYSYTFNATTVSYADAFNWQNSADDASVNFPGIGSSSSGSNWSSTGGSGWVGFVSNTGNLTGILPAGTYSFNFQAEGNTFNTNPGASSSGHYGNFGNFTGQTYPASADFTLLLTPLPEPTTMMLLGAGLVALAGYGWRRRRAGVPGARLP